MKNVFISYRRADSAVFTGRLFDRLTEYYGAGTIFLDIDSIPGSADFRDVVKDHIKDCGVFLAVIGQKWAGSPDRPRRIDDPGDHVRIEVEQAIADKKPIIPVYCDDLEELKPADVPASLGPLVYANARRIDPGRDFHQHVQRLRREINRILFPSWFAIGLHVARRFVRRNTYWLAAIAVLALLVFLVRDRVGRTLITDPGLQAAAADKDPAAFSRGRGGKYEVARALPDREALVGETDLVETIRNTQQSFDAFALTGSAFYNNPEAMMDGFRRGVRFRILLMDHSETNKAHVECHFEFCGVHGSDYAWSRDNAKLAQEAFQMRRAEAMRLGLPGTVEVRWWRGPFHNSFWIRDGRTPNALAHAELSYYGDALLNPSLRFGRLSPRMTDSLQDQFDYVWGLSKAE